MRKSPLAAVVEVDSQVIQPHTSANGSDVVGKRDRLELLRVDPSVPPRLMAA